MSGRYSLVGCSSCDALKIVDGHPKTTQCSNCEKQLRFRKLKKFYQSDDSTQVSHAKAIIVARREGKEDEINEMIEAGLINGDIRSAISDEEYLRAKGVNPDEVDKSQSVHTPKKPSVREIVFEAIEETEDSTQTNIVAFAAEQYGKDPERFSDILEELYLKGEVTRSQEGIYRVV